MLTQHQPAPENTPLLQVPEFQSGLPHPTSSWAMLPRCRHSCRSPLCRSASAAEWKLCRSAPLHWLHLTQREASEEKRDDGVNLRNSLKTFFFSFKHYVGHLGRVKKEEFIFPKDSFCRAASAGLSHWGWNRVYLSNTFPRNAAFKAGVRQSDFLTRD